MDYAVIMAGGSGTRLWPLSRQKRPKQVIDIFGGQTLIRKSFERLLPVFPAERIFIQTNANHVDIVRRILPEVPVENIIGEPYMRNTAGAVGLAASFIAARDADASMTIVTADHIIEPVAIFAQTIRNAVSFVNAKPDHLVTFGIKPTFASTQYGYLCLGKADANDGFDSYKVESFREKPDLTTAQEYLEKGNYSWNSGMFVWKARTILNNLYQYLPDCKEPLEKIQKQIGTKQQNETIEKIFVEVPKISIDYAVMEKSPAVYAIKLDCKWFDMGSYEALTDVMAGNEQNNIISGTEPELIDSTKNIIINQQDGHIIAGIGLEDMIIAHTDDVTFICPREKIDQIKQMLEQVQENKGEKYI